MSRLGFSGNKFVIYEWTNDFRRSWTDRLISSDENETKSPSQLKGRQCISDLLGIPRPPGYYPDVKVSQPHSGTGLSLWFQSELDHKTLMGFSPSLFSHASWREPSPKFLWRRAFCSRHGGHAPAAVRSLSNAQALDRGLPCGIWSLVAADLFSFVPVVGNPAIAGILTVNRLSAEVACSGFYWGKSEEDALFRGFLTSVAANIFGCLCYLH